MFVCLAEFFFCIICVIFFYCCSFGCSYGLLLEVGALMSVVYFSIWCRDADNGNNDLKVAQSVRQIKLTCRHLSQDIHSDIYHLIFTHMTFITSHLVFDIYLQTFTIVHIYQPTFTPDIYHHGNIVYCVTHISF